MCLSLYVCEECLSGCTLTYCLCGTVVGLGIKVGVSGRVCFAICCPADEKKLLMGPSVFNGSL